MGKSYNHKNSRGFSPLVLPSANEHKPIIAEYRDGVLRPTGGKYFRPYYNKLRDSVIASDTKKGKKIFRRRERQQLKQQLDEFNEQRK